jgi:hypothetical protein
MTVKGSPPIGGIADGLAAVVALRAWPIAPILAPKQARFWVKQVWIEAAAGTDRTELIAHFGGCP